MSINELEGLAHGNMCLKNLMENHRKKKNFFCSLYLFKEQIKSFPRPPRPGDFRNRGSLLLAPPLECLEAW
jgi:hypothetical protein